ncbi:MORN repeat-containing protein 1 [Morphnus guianensis]
MASLAGEETFTSTSRVKGGGIKAGFCPAIGPPGGRGKGALPRRRAVRREIRTSCSLKMEVTMRASLSVEKLWGMDFNTGHQQGQWRNDVFDEQGAIVNCSGDICDGLWINGYPAAILDLHWLIYQSLREIEPESGSDTLCGAGDASSSQHECFNMDESHSHEKNLWLTEVTMQRKKKGGKKPSGRISAEKAEKMTVSQEKMEDSRSHMTSKEYKLQKD